MSDLVTQIDEYLELYTKVQNEARSELKRLPDERIRFDFSKKKPRFFYVGDQGKRVYLRKISESLIQALIQKRYCEKMCAGLDETIAVLQKARHILEGFAPGRLNRMAAEMTEKTGYKLEPFLMSDDEYAESWESRPYECNSGYVQNLTFTTNRGEHVRSKSEKIIADFLYDRHIPYRYEPVIDLEDYFRVAPDFALLNKRTREVLYWEHFGMIDDPEYFENVLHKVLRYNNSGYHLGEKIFYTCETREHPFDLEEVKDYIIKSME